MTARDDETEGSAARHTLTRAQVAARLGISVATVRRLEWDKLHPEVDDRGVHRFDPAEVEAVTSPRQRATPRETDRGTRERSREGRLAANVFRMFARQSSLRQIVVATKQPPEVIRQLYSEWSKGLEEGEWERRQARET